MPIDAKKKDRISFNLEDDGAIANMHPETREKLKRVFSDPRTAKSLGLTETKTTSGGLSNVPPFILPIAVTAINRATILLLHRFVKLPGDQLIAVATYTPDERAQIEEPLRQVLEKYSGDLLEKWGPEVALLLAVVMIGYVKFDNAQELESRVVRPDFNPKHIQVVRPPAPPEPPPPPPPIKDDSPSAELDVAGDVEGDKK